MYEVWTVPRKARAFGLRPRTCFVLACVLLPIIWRYALPQTPPQSQPGSLPTFEVATIKPAKPDNYKPVGIYTYPGGRVVVAQATLKMMIEYAYNVRSFQVSGGPRWADEDLFDVVGLPSDTSQARQLKPAFVNVPPTDEQREMLQSLLKERFKLVVRPTLTPGTQYDLVRTDKPLRLSQAKHPKGMPLMIIGGYGNGGMRGQSVSMQYMAQRLSMYFEHPVMDRTTLPGSYDFTTQPASGDSRDEPREEF